MLAFELTETLVWSFTVNSIFGCLFIIPRSVEKYGNISKPITASKGLFIIPRSPEKYGKISKPITAPKIKFYSIGYLSKTNNIKYHQ